MAREIRWSKRIEFQIDIILIYLLEEWGDKVADRFQNEIIGLAEQLARNSGIGYRVEGNHYSFPIRVYRLHYYIDGWVVRMGYLQDMRSNREMIE